MLRGESLHALHVFGSGGDRHRVVIRVRSVQAWIPQDQRHCQFLRFLRRRRRRRRKTLHRLCTAAIVLVLSILLFHFVLVNCSGDLFVSFYKLVFVRVHICNYLLLVLGIHVWFNNQLSLLQCCYCFCWFSPTLFRFFSGIIFISFEFGFIISELQKLWNHSVSRTHV